MNDKIANSNRPAIPDFLWGVSTSAFQIEGYLENDMIYWEQEGRFRENGKNPLYKNAVKHWKKWKTDYQLLAELGVNSYRFSMEWGRLQPEPDKFNEEALDQYDKMIDRLCSLNIIPMLTLHHFTHPTWFHEKSPWHSAEAAGIFTKYVEKIVQRFADRIPLFVTFNEPVVWVLAAYGEGKFPPGKKNLSEMAVALNHILQAHQLTYDLIKKYNPRAQVGIANNFIIFEPCRRWNILDRGLSYFIHRFYNLVLPETFRNNRIKIDFPFLLHYKEDLQLADKIDFWGINYYYRMHIHFALNLENPMLLEFHHRSGEGMSDMGWEVYSAGLREVMKLLLPFRKPFYITENGVSDSNDKLRISFLKSHLKIVKEARQSGWPLRGYYHWSLLDNYEWLEGTSARFGLYEVNYDSDYKRSLRTSGELYSRYIRNNP